MIIYKSYKCHRRPVCLLSCRATTTLCVHHVTSALFSGHYPQFNGFTVWSLWLYLEPTLSARTSILYHACVCVYIVLYLLKSKIYIRPRTTPNVHTTPSLGTPISPSYYYNDYVDCLTSMWVHQCQTIIWTTLLSVGKNDKACYWMLRKISRRHIFFCTHI